MDWLQILPSARKHHVLDEDIAYAWENAERLVPFDINGDERLLVIGPNRSGKMLELVAVPADAPARIIHAMPLQKNRRHYLK